MRTFPRFTLLDRVLPLDVAFRSTRHGQFSMKRNPNCSAVQTDRNAREGGRPALIVLPALGAILLWGFLAVISTQLLRLPSLLVTGVGLTIGGLIGLPWAKQWKVPLVTLCVGTASIFGYHFLLFTAFRNAPTVEANIINYLWPLLIVVLTPAVLTGYRLAVRHVLGALVALSGVVLVVSGGTVNFDLSAMPGYAAAFGAAIVWALYSLLTKRLPPFPSSAVGAFCLLAGVLSLAIYALSSGMSGLGEIRPADWLYLGILGVGPLGAAFYLWDASLKRGDPRAIGSLSYLTPLLSTMSLVVLGERMLTPLSGVAMVLVIGVAAIGSIRGRLPSRQGNTPCRNTGI